MFLRAEITGLHEIHDAPQIEQPIFQRRAGERQAMLGLQLLDRLRDLRAGILDELRFVENHRAEGEFLQLLQIAPQQRVIGHDRDRVAGFVCADCAAPRRFRAPALSSAA